MSLASQSDSSAPSASQQDIAYVEDVVRKASSSFFWAMRSLPLERRQAIFAVYAFCRVVDDIADDEDMPLEERRRLLQGWREEISDLYSRAPSDAITRALLVPIDAFDLEKPDFIDVINGMEMDAKEAIVAPPWDDLVIYCDRVACAVGRLCVKIFGEPSDNGKAVATALGTALQLTNILRDVHEDAGRGRVYLSREVLAANGISSNDPDEILAHPNLLAAWHDLAEKADEAFADAERAMARCEPGTMRPAKIMMEVYRRNFGRMMSRATHEVPKPPDQGSFGHYLHKAEKLLIAARYGLT